MVTTDEKSGYDHVRLSVESQKYFGIQFGYWVLVYTVNLHIPNKRHDRNVLWFQGCVCFVARIIKVGLYIVAGKCSLIP